MPGLYVHIPFCIKKCRYCDFISFADRHGLEGYFRALHKEIALAAPMASHIAFDTVFIGGGTPSISPAGEIEALLNAVRASFRIASGAEITLESNPGTLTREKLSEYRRAGVNRLSIGLQSADDDLLRRIGRIHTYRDFEASFYMAREAGFANINTDVMYGLPGQTQENFLCTLETLRGLAPEHISAYSLILEEGTPLYDDVMQGRESVPDEDAVADMQEAGQAFLAESGYIQYEISNYAKPGYECRHNVNYWENGEYLGIGAAAHGALRLGGQWTRRENSAELSEYFSQIAAGVLPAARMAAIEKSEEMFESVMLGLRMVKGLSMAAFERRYGIKFEDAYPAACRKLTERNWLTLSGGRAALTKHGLMLQNTALMEFME